MWVVIKYKSKELYTLKKSLIENLDKELKFYIPQIKYKKKVKNKFLSFEKNILDNYLICFHKKFSDINLISKLKYLKGLSCFLNGYKNSQKEIINFIDYCRSHEDEQGYLNGCFFDQLKFKKGKFISGPFTNMIFEIIERQKNNIKVLIGNKKATVSISDNLFSPI